MCEVDTEGKQQALDALADCQNFEAMQWKIWQVLPAESRDQNGPDLADYPGAAFLNTFLFHKGDGHWPDFNAIANEGAGPEFPPKRLDNANLPKPSLMKLPMSCLWLSPRPLSST